MAIEATVIENLIKEAFPDADVTVMVQMGFICQQ